MARSRRSTSPRGAGLIYAEWIVAFYRALAADPDQAVVFGAALTLLLVSAFFGGASQANALSLMAVELASLPLLFIASYRLALRRGPRGATLALILLGAIVAIPVLQLAPLPASVWTKLPQRGPVTDILDAAKLGRPALSYSLTPEETWRALLALAPPAAMFMGALLMSDRQLRMLAGCWLVIAFISLAVGVLQILGGISSPLYFYQITNLGAPVGLFANRNHQAAFLYALIPVAAAFASEFRGAVADRRALPAVFAILYVCVAVIGVAVTRSRAGVFLAALALVGSLAVAWHDGVLRRNWRASAALGLGATVAVAAVLLFALGPILDRFGQGGSQELRFEGWPVILGAARDYMPLGSGVGSFDAVYRSVEPLGQVSPVYFNHAHNDYLEIWLETGFAGAIVLAAFAVWLGVQSLRIWIERHASGSGLAPAMTLLICLLLAHSAVDYPLRTETLAVLFAYACGVIARAGFPTQAKQDGRHVKRRARSQS